MNDPLEAIRYEIALSHVPFIGPKRMDRLLDSFGSAEAAWAASESRLGEVLDSRSCRSLVRTRGELDVDRALNRVRGIGAETLVRTDPAYPPQLRELPGAPFLLYVAGDAKSLSAPGVAVVGTRKASAYGQRAARRLAGDLAAAGICIVSGMAVGIDGAAHRAALDVGGTTVAVLGCGLDVPYPKSNLSLLSDIPSSGAVVSEYPPGTPPAPGNFPARNRIVSGLSVATIVVEAGAKSGALITARCALDQGRDVFAVPGSIFSVSHSGANGLLGAGAGVALAADDVLAALELSLFPRPLQTDALGAGSECQSKLLEELGSEPVHIDELGRIVGMHSSDIARELAMLELRGLVENTGGMRWVAVQ